MLSTADGEGGSDDAATTRGSATDRFGEFPGDGVERFVKAIAVGTFEDEVIDGREMLGVFDDGQADAADIAGETEAEGTAVLFVFEGNTGGAEHVPSAMEAEVEAAGDVGFLMHLYGTKEGLGVFGILDRVEGAILTIVGFFADHAAAMAAFVEEFAVAFLDEGGVLEHGFAQIGGGGGGVNGAAKSGFVERGEIAAVVDVGVREDDGVNVATVKGKIAVALFGFTAAALVEAAIEQDALTVQLEDVHGTGDCFGGSPKS